MSTTEYNKQEIETQGGDISTTDVVVNEREDGLIDIVGLNIVRIGGSQGDIITVDVQGVDETSTFANNLDPDISGADSQANNVLSVALDVNDSVYIDDPQWQKLRAVQINTSEQTSYTIHYRRVTESGDVISGSGFNPV